MNKKGSVSTEFCISFPLIGLPLLGWALLTSLKLFSLSLLYADSFFSARAHLYGNAMESCDPSKFWPTQMGHFKINKKCSHQGNVDLSLEIPSLLENFPEIKTQTNFNLVKNYF